MKTAFIDCSSGAAGDMLLAALVDAGASEDFVRRCLDSLPIEGWTLSFVPVRKQGLAARKAVVEIGDQTRRRYDQMVNVLTAPSLDPKVSKRARDTFESLARAEARVHGTSVEEVHFHEVGSTDALIDIVGCCAALESLQIDHVVVSPIATGAGTIETEHGVYPLPAPAVVEILRGVPATTFGRGSTELTTPTGAALLATNTDRYEAMPPMTIETVGYGAGDADLEWPNVVRVLVGTASRARGREPSDALVVESNIDDMSPELFPHAIDALLGAGAHDAWVTPIVMKKGRPAFTLSALCSPEQEATVIDVFFRETTTLGLRTRPVSKHVLEREWIETRIDGASVRVKVGRNNGDIATIAPEHDDAARAATDLGLPLRVVYERSIEEAKKLLAGSGAP